MKSTKESSLEKIALLGALISGTFLVAGGVDYVLSKNDFTGHLAAVIKGISYTGQKEEEKEYILNYVFSNYDTNHDNIITKEEYGSALEK